MSYTKPAKQALVIEGGAMRSVFSSGILDGFMEHNFNPFNLYLGVSAGAYNLATYLAKSPGLSFRIFTEAACSKQFINFPRFFRGGHLLDLDWLSSIVMDKYKFDLETLSLTGKAFYVCATAIFDGQANYIRVTPDNFLQAIKASTALPLIYRQFPAVDNIAMTDGGVADGIPVEKAMELGATRIMVIRSRPYGYVKRDSLWHKYIRWKLQNHPALVQTMKERVIRFENTIRIMRNPPPGIRILEICPPATFKSGRFTRNSKILTSGYQAGYLLARQYIQQWQQLTG